MSFDLFESHRLNVLGLFSSLDLERTESGRVCRVDGWPDRNCPGRRKVSEGVMYFDFGVSNVKKHFSLSMFTSHISNLLGFFSFFLSFFLFKSGTDLTWAEELARG